MTKKEIILQAASELLHQQGSCQFTVSEIAQQADIAKGSIYSVFKSREQIFEALAEQYEDKLQEKAAAIVAGSTSSASKIIHILQLLDDLSLSLISEYLRLPDNAALHQRLTARLILSLSSSLAECIHQGTEEGIFKTQNPQELAEIVLTSFCFLLNPGIFAWTDSQLAQKKKAILSFFESALFHEKKLVLFDQEDLG